MHVNTLSNSIFTSIGLNFNLYVAFLVYVSMEMSGYISHTSFEFLAQHNVYPVFS